MAQDGESDFCGGIASNNMDGTDFNQKNIEIARAVIKSDMDP